MGQTTIFTTGGTTLLLKDSDSTNPADRSGIAFVDQNNTQTAFIGKESASDSVLTINNTNTINPIRLKVNNTTRLEVGNTGVYATGSLSATGTLSAGDTLYIPDNIQHTGDTNTQIRFPAADTISFETAGGERFRIDSSGRLIVGGGTDPAESTIVAKGNSTSATSYSVLDMRRGQAATSAGDVLGYIRFSDTNIDSNNKNYGLIFGACDGTSSSGSDNPGRLVFSTTSDDGAGPLERLRIDSEGIVTVNHGNATSSAVFKIAKDSNGEAQLRFETASANTASIVLDSSEQLKFKYGGTEVLRIDSNGRLQIGSSTNTSYNQFSGTGRLNINNNSADGTVDFTQGIVFTDNSNNTGTWTHGAIVCVGSSGYNGDMVFGTDGNGQSTSNITEKMRITYDGRVYIGATSGGNADNDDLVISGSGKKGITVCSTNGSETRLVFADGLSGTNAVVGQVLYDHSANRMDFYTSTNRRVSITSSGDFGIGTNSPDRKLDVSGTGNVYGKFQSTNATGAGIEVKDASEDWLIQADGGSVDGLAFYDLGRTAYRFIMGNAGQLGIGGANYGSSGQVLTSGGASSAPSWTTVTGTTINNNADNRIITGSGTANTLEGESTLIFGGGVLSNSSSNDEKIVLSGSASPYIRFRDASNSNKGYIQMHSNGNMYLVNQATNEYLRIGSGAGGLYFSVDGSENVVAHSGYIANSLWYTEGQPSFVGNWGQFENHGTYTNANTEPAYWGWSYSTGNTNFPNTNSSQWYRGRFSLGNGYGKGTDAGDYWMEITVPRSAYNTTAGQMYVRTCENGSEQAWCEVGSVPRTSVIPYQNNSIDLGSSSVRWRNIYTNDLNLSNKGTTNSVDNTWGDFTIQEGENDLYLINNRNGKKYKFNLTEVS